MSYPGAVSRVNPYKIRQQKAREGAYDTNKKVISRTSAEDRLKKAKYDRRLAKIEAGTAQYENTKNGYTEAPDSAIWGQNGGGGQKPAQTQTPAPRVTESKPAPQALPVDSSSTLDGGNAVPSMPSTPQIQTRRPTQVLTADEETPKAHEELPPAPSPSPMPAMKLVNPNAHSPNSIKSSKAFREYFKGATKGNGILKKGQKLHTGPFAGMTRQEARKKARLKFNSAA